MSTKIETSKQLGDAMKRGDDIIEIEGDLVKKVIKIRATGKVAWAVVAGAIAVTIFTTPGTGVVGAPVSGLAAVGAATVLGTATSTAIAIAIVGGGIGVLTSLRSYKEVSRSENTLILRKK